MLNQLCYQTGPSGTCQAVHFTSLLENLRKNKLIDEYQRKALLRKTQDNVYNNAACIKETKYKSSIAKIKWSFDTNKQYSVEHDFPQ